MTPLAFPDAELLAKAYLEATLPVYVEDVAVGIGVPVDWVRGESGDYLQVSLDGTPSIDSNVLARATVRLVAWSSSTSRAKELAAKAQAVLVAHPGGTGIKSVQALTGPLPSRDAGTGGELSAVTCRVNVRSAPLEPILGS